MKVLAKNWNIWKNRKIYNIVFDSLRKYVKQLLNENLHSIYRTQNEDHSSEGIAKEISPEILAKTVRETWTQLIL